MATSDYDHDIPKEWDAIFMSMAKELAMRSKDPSTKCGAVLVDKANHIISGGFNGPPAGIDDEFVPWQLRPQKYAYILHAEENAILDALSRGMGEALTESKLYCTHYPCTECALRCIRWKLKTIYVPSDHKPYAMSKYQVDVEALLSKQKYPKLDIRFTYAG